MLTELLAYHVGIPETSVTRLLSLSPQGLLSDQEYQNLINSLDYDQLSQHLPVAREAYDQHLPRLIDGLRSDLNYTGKPMSAHTLGNWLLGFLHDPNHLETLVGMHDQLPPNIFSYGLPRLLDILAKMPAGGEQWQRALATLSLPLLARR